ncbi:MAG: GNAT family N-acetyltransferase [Lishizhenia sp.]
MFEGTNIKLRRVEEKDAFHLMLWENNPDNWRVSGTEIPFSLDEINQYIEHAQNYRTTGQLRFVIESIDSEEAVGCIDLFEMNFKHKRAGVGILINNAEHRKKGFAKEALSLLEDYVKQTFDFQQLFANIQADNTTSISLFKKMGFEQSGIKKNWYSFENYKVDELFFQKIIE